MELKTARNEDDLTQTRNTHTNTQIHVFNLRYRHCNGKSNSENECALNEIELEKMDNIIKTSDGRSIWGDAYSHTNIEKLNILLILYVYYSRIHDGEDATHTEAQVSQGVLILIVFKLKKSIQKNIQCFALAHTNENRARNRCA